MNELLSMAPDAGANSGSPADASVARGDAGSAAGKPAVGSPVASATASPEPERKGRFQFAPDTPEGIKERREADAERKRVARAEAAKRVEPPPLPTTGATLARDNTSPGGPLAGSGSDSPGEPEAPAVPWSPELLTDLVGELLTAAEQGRVAQFAAKCKEAGIMGRLFVEMERDVHFPKAAVVLLRRSLPRLAAKYLNKAGLSSEYCDELSVITALLLIVKNDRSVNSKLDAWLEEQRKRKPEAS